MRQKVPRDDWSQEVNFRRTNPGLSDRLLLDNGLEGTPGGFKIKFSMLYP